MTCTWPCMHPFVFVCTYTFMDGWTDGWIWMLCMYILCLTAGKTHGSETHFPRRQSLFVLPCYCFRCTLTGNPMQIIEPSAEEYSGFGPKPKSVCLAETVPQDGIKLRRTSSPRADSRLRFRLGLTNGNPPDGGQAGKSHV